MAIRRCARALISITLVWPSAICLVQCSMAFCTMPVQFLDSTSALAKKRLLYSVYLSTMLVDVCIASLVPARSKQVTESSHTGPIQCVQILIHSQKVYQIYMNNSKGFNTLCRATCNATMASHLCWWLFNVIGCKKVVKCLRWCWLCFQWLLLFALHSSQSSLLYKAASIAFVWWCQQLVRRTSRDMALLWSQYNTQALKRIKHEPPSADWKGFVEKTIESEGESRAQTLAEACDTALAETEWWLLKYRM